MKMGFICVLCKNLFIFFLRLLGQRNGVKNFLTAEFLNGVYDFGKKKLMPKTVAHLDING